MTSKNCNPDNIIQIPNYQITETIYSGSRTIVYRAIRISDQLPVVIKLLKNPYPSFSELVQFRNQYTIAKNLNSPLIIQTYSLEPYQNSYALVMEDFGGISLKEWVVTRKKPLSLMEFLQLAITLSNTLEILSSQGIIHKDIKPSNILINPETKQIKLIDFSIASLLPRETQTLMNPNVLEGTLAYISPEQTGRMNRGIDYRTDFYSLGITFYELLTGELPFQSNDLMELVHFHMAKMPILLGDREEISPVIYEIVMKLMAKNAEDRYQTASGLKHDLEQCLKQLQETGNIINFKIAQRDFCDYFIIPEKLYGRETEVQQLLAAFDRVTQGQSEMMLVAGFSGVGKTAVINEVHKPIVRQRGYFIKGKYDQFNRDIPFSAFVEAFRNLMAQLLSETDTQLEQWKTQILSALGENGQVIIDVIPELEQIIGEQPTVAKLSGSAAQNRFNLLFQKFTQVFTRAQHPLVIFLDDLQWADSASLNLIERLMTETTDYLLLIGAYRDNEVSKVHPLMLTLEEIAKAKTIIHTITLAPLSQTDINYLIADTLNCSLTLAQPLTELLHRKTRGNPFFTTVFLKVLHEEGIIRFDFQLGHWQCDITQVKMLALTSDVVEFMGMQLQKLPQPTQDVLKLAACIGNQFDLATLAIVHEKSLTETASDLWKALQEGLILPENQVYKFFQDVRTDEEKNTNAIATDHPDTLSILDSTTYPSYCFLHDRVQQAAYSLIPRQKKQAVHLKIGQLLKKNTPETHLEERLFEITNQLNIAVELITSLTERQELAQLNLLASRKAKASTAYLAALKSAQTGINLLPENRWQTQYDLTLKLHQIATEAAYLSGNLEQMEALAKPVLNFTKTPLEQVSTYQVLIEALTAQGQFTEAIKTSLKILQQLGIELPSKPTEDDVETAFQTVSNALAERLPSELLNLPETTEVNIQAAAQILTSAAPVAYLFEPQLYLLIILKKVYLSVIYGQNSTSPFAYASYAILMCAVTGNIELGYEFGQLALELLSRQHNSELKGKTLLIVSIYTSHWKIHLCETLQPLQIAYCSCLDVGDLAFAGYSAYNYGLYSYFAGENLTQLELEMDGYCQALKQMKQTLNLAYSQLSQQIFLNLIGDVDDVRVLNGKAYNEQHQIPLYEAAGDRTGLALFWINKLIISYLFSDFEKAIEQAQQARQYLDAVLAFVYVPIFHFYESLAYLAIFKKRSRSQQQQIEKLIASNQEKLKKFSIHAPMNFQHKYDLVEAEHYRVLGQQIEAMEYYDRAISGAKENAYIQEEGIANELAAKFYLDWNKNSFAQIYITNAYYCYARWGAKAKVADLETHYPQLLQLILQQQRLNLNPSETLVFPATCSSTQTSSNSLSSVLDFASVLKAAQAISSSLELETLIGSLTQIILENSGAKKVVLILPQNKTWQVQAIALIDQENIQTTFTSQLLEDCQDIPINIVHYVKNTKQTIEINNCQTDIPWLIGEYMLKYQPQSILCTPILNQGNLVGILYLENPFTSWVFTRDRLSIINLLSSQAAISLENARLYKQAQQALQDLQQTQLQMIQSEKMSALGNLVAGVAHEINNPVGFISGNLNEAKSTVQDLVQHLNLYRDRAPETELADHAKDIDLDYIIEDLPKIIDSMQLGCDRIKSISTSLRTFSRADKDYKVPFNIHDGIDSTILILKYRLKANEQRPAIEVITDYANLPKIDCFPGQLNQVFINIIANAIDALDESNTNRSFAEIKANPNRIKIKTSVENERVKISIADNGKGMKEEVKQKIFDHLFTTKAVGKGTGLGLAIARPIIVEKHQGSISVNSEIGVGTEFAISLPTK